MNAYSHLAIDVHDLPFATVKKLEQTVLKQGDVLFTSASETPDECAISSVIEDAIQEGVFLDDHLFGLRIKNNFKNCISPSFLKYTFSSEVFRSQIKKAVRGATRFYISKPAFMKLTIPVPPLPVQREIVRILDNFTELTAELTAEHTARKKQYEYYRDSLLMAQYGTPLSTIGNLCSIKGRIGFRGYTQKDFVRKGEGAISLSPGNIISNHLRFDDCKYITWEKYYESPEIMLSEKDVILCKTGSTVGKVAVVDRAKALLDAGQYEEAIAAFEALGEYKDSPEQIVAAREAIAEAERLAKEAQLEADNAAAYDEAESLLANNRYADAYHSFLALGNYKDSASRADTIKAEHYADIISVGDVIFLGAYEQDNNASNGKEDIEWIVLYKQNNRVLVVSKCVLDYGCMSAFHSPHGMMRSICARNSFFFVRT